MVLTEFILLAPVSLFVIINPFSTVPAFLAITPGESAEERIRSARLACLVAGGIMLFFAVAGQFLFSVLGITLPAFQIAGGALLFAIAFDMLRSPDAPIRLSPAEKALATEKEDIAVTPLAIPLLCGPGAISTAIILQTQADRWSLKLTLYLSVPVVYLGCYLVLRTAAKGAGWINPLILRILRRLMGLIFAAIAVQFVVNGVSALPFLNGAT
ncbi:MAG: MarC family protein [Verrucomicrobiota bacterium]